MIEEFFSDKGTGLLVDGLDEMVFFGDAGVRELDGVVGGGGGLVVEEFADGNIIYHPLVLIGSTALLSHNMKVLQKFINTIIYLLNAIG